MHGNFHATADVVPVDIATNAMIVVAWYTAVERYDKGNCFLFNVLKCFSRVSSNFCLL